MTDEERWPAVPSTEFHETCTTLQLWMQIAGKIALALTPLTNHFWNIAFQVTSRGIASPAIPYDTGAFTMTFDLITHRLVIHCSDGRVATVPLEPRTVADFYRRLMSTLHELGIDVTIWTMPVEVENPIRFERDQTHSIYDPRSAHDFWRMLLTIKPVLERFRCEFVGKCSPVHFFWGSFDLAVTRFSGRRAPGRAGADAVTREAYSHEVISHGFWPGSGAVAEPAFYAYAAPEPAGFKKASVRPAAAFYSTDFNEFILPYDAVRRADAPDADLTAFLETTYDAAATLGGWDRAALERSAPPGNGGDGANGTQTEKRSNGENLFSGPKENLFSRPSS
jgi:hypothetical protein